MNKISDPLQPFSLRGGWEQWSQLKLFQTSGDSTVPQPPPHISSARVRCRRDVSKKTSRSVNLISWWVSCFSFFSLYLCSCSLFNHSLRCFCVCFYSATNLAGRNKIDWLYVSQILRHLPPSACSPCSYNHSRSSVNRHHLGVVTSSSVTSAGRAENWTNSCVAASPWTGRTHRWGNKSDAWTG